ARGSGRPPRAARCTPPSTRKPLRARPGSGLHARGPHAGAALPPQGRRRDVPFVTRPPILQIRPAARTVLNLPKDGPKMKLRLLTLLAAAASLAAFVADLPWGH